MRRQSIRKGITLLSGVIRESKISSLLATLDRLNALISREKSFVRFCRVQKNRLQRERPYGGSVDETRDVFPLEPLDDFFRDAMASQGTAW